jgi:hypothetical protein
MNKTKGKSMPHENQTEKVNKVRRLLREIVAIAGEPHHNIRPGIWSQWGLLTEIAGDVAEGMSADGPERVAVGVVLAADEMQLAEISARLDAGGGHMPVQVHPVMDLGWGEVPTVGRVLVLVALEQRTPPAPRRNSGNI